MTFRCALCSHDDYQLVEKIAFGTWQSVAEYSECSAEASIDSTNDSSPNLMNELVRDSAQYAIVACGQCQHVQMYTQYDESLVNTLYFHSHQESVMWHEQLDDSIEPYQNMVDFCEAFIDENAVIADFGCGTGSLLKAFRAHKKTNNCRNSYSLLGTDFNPRCGLDFVEYQASDLNDTEALTQLSWQKEISLACASHTLEHLQHPVEFLQALGKQVKDDGYVFIEVPDFSYSLNYQMSGQSNLVNLQHIQYFTLASLISCATKAGLEMVKSKQVITGYIPRLLVMLRRTSASNTSALVTSTMPVTKLTKASQTEYASRSVDNNSAAESVRTFLKHAQQKRQYLIDSVLKSTDAGEKPALWGIGADVYLMLQNDAFKACVSAGKVQLFDYTLAGKYLQGQAIEHSNALSECQDKIFLTPILAETRIKMHKVARVAKVKVFDVFAFDYLALNGPSVQSCQVCQQTDWRAIDTLYSGVWEEALSISAAAPNSLPNEVSSSVLKSESKDDSADNMQTEIVRKELNFDIAQCQSCQHVQISTPFTQCTIDKLYFSSNDQPQMWFIEGGQKNPYDEMVDFFEPLLTDANNIADFGCGEGLLLAAIKSRAPDASLIGFDFSKLENHSGIRHVSCDLNDYHALSLINEGDHHHSEPFDLICSSHVLEHVFNPVLYLSALKSLLSDDGKLFIEVPDCSHEHAQLALQQTNIVHGQHIHYFSQATLISTAQRAGLSLLDARCLVTGNIPRIQCLFGQSSSSVLMVSQALSSYSAVKSRFSKYNIELSALANMTRQQLDSQGIVHIWGIGGDFFALLREHADIKKAVIQGDILLYDYSLAGKRFEGNTIQCSTQLSTLNDQVVIAPLYEPTRASMQSAAKGWNVSLLTPLGE